MSYVARFSWPFGPSLPLKVMAKSTSDMGRTVEMSGQAEMYRTITLLAMSANFMAELRENEIF
jgi:hypothetical protein